MLLLFASIIQIFEFSLLLTISGKAACSLPRETPGRSPLLSKLLLFCGGAIRDMSNDEVTHNMPL
jgi:hypothetical protein